MRTQSERPEQRRRRLQANRQIVAECDALVVVDGDGYAVDVRCETRHAGNRRLANSHPGWWECQGCARYVSGADVLEVQHEMKTPPKP